MRSESVDEAVEPVTHRVSRMAHIGRYREIVGVLVKYGFVDVVHALHLIGILRSGRL